MNLAEKELCSVSDSFDWLDEDEFEQLPGPIAFEYKRLKEYTKAGNIEASLWKLVNLANVTLSYLFAVVLEKDLNQNRCCLGDEIKRDYRNPSVRQKINRVRNLQLSKKLNPLLNIIQVIMDWRNNYGTGHGVLLRKQTYYISEEIILLYKTLLKTFLEFPQILRDNNLSLISMHSGNGADNFLTPITGTNYLEKFKGDEWGSWLACDSKTTINVNNSAIRFHGYQFDIPDIYFFESFFIVNNLKRFTFRNYSQNRVKLFYTSEKIAWEDEPRQVAWLDEDERVKWWDYYYTVSSDSDLFKKLIYILVDAAGKFQLLGIYDQAIKCAEEVIRFQVEPEHAVKANLALYSAEAAQGNYDIAESYLSKAKEVVSQVREIDKETGTFLNAQISDQESWHIGVSRENAEKALGICEESLNELEKIEDKYPFSALMLQLELRKNKLYISRDLESRDSHTLRNECLKVLGKTREIYSIDPENRRNVDIYGFACNHYRKHTCDLINLKIVEAKEVEDVERIINEGLEVRKKAFDSYDMDIWSVRGYAWSIHDKARFLMDMKKDYSTAEELLKESRNLRQEYLNRFPDDNGVLMDLVKNYADLYKAERQAKGDRNKELSKKASKALRQISEGEGESERVNSLKKLLSDSGLQYIENS